MPGPVIHLSVALVALLLYFDKRDHRYVLILLPLAVLPDLDHFAPFYAPRLYFHSVFILVSPLAIALYGWASKRELAFDVGLMAGFCLLSHVVLDFFVDSGEALFYPLSTAKFGFLVRPEFLYRPEILYEILTEKFLPQSLWHANALPLGIMLCVIVFFGILVVRKRVRSTIRIAVTT